jgi:hypothetical protein
MVIFRCFLYINGKQLIINLHFLNSKDWNELAQRQREDADCGLTTSTPKCDKCHKVKGNLALYNEVKPIFLHGLLTFPLLYLR